MTGGLSVTMVRHVAVWFYVVTGAAALLAVYWMVRRRFVRFGMWLMGAGIVVNAMWELLLFTVWGRRYETGVPTVAQAAYHSLTEFGPLLVLAVVALDWAGYIDLSPLTDSAETRIHHVMRSGVIAISGVAFALVLGVLVVDPEYLTTPITVYRDVTWWYFAAEAVLGMVVLGAALRRGDRTALALFLVLGTFNVVFEVAGLAGGYRTYAGLSPFASVFIGFAESGIAGAIVWQVVVVAISNRAYLFD